MLEDVLLCSFPTHMSMIRSGAKNVLQVLEGTGWGFTISHMQNVWCC